LPHPPQYYFRFCDSKSYPTISFDTISVVVLDDFNVIDNHSLLIKKVKDWELGLIIMRDQYGSKFGYISEELEFTSNNKDIVCQLGSNITFTADAKLCPITRDVYTTNTVSIGTDFQIKVQNPLPHCTVLANGNEGSIPSFVLNQKYNAIVYPWINLASNLNYGNELNIKLLWNCITFLDDRSNVNFQSTFLQDIKSVIDDESMMDITFILNNEKVKGNKTILSLRSQYFKMMFNTGMKESKSNEITLPITDPEPFKIIIKYLHTDILDLNDTTCIKVFELAKMYMLDKLVQLVQNYLVKHMSQLSISLLTWSHQNNEKDILILCLNYLSSNWSSFKNSKEIEELDKEVLIMIVKNI